MSKQVAIYTRVSTEDQAEHGYSLDSQRESCENFAHQLGFNASTIFTDDISGTTPVQYRPGNNGQPGGSELYKSINSGQINVVIVYQVDRLSRDIVDLLATIRNWLRAGVEIYAMDIGRITSELDIVLVIKGWQGGDERQKIRERTMRGRNAKAKAGKVVGQGAAPFGYCYSDGDLSIIETEAHIVRMIYDWYVNGNENGGMMSLIGIAKKLTAMGVPTPAISKGMNSRHEKYGIWHYGSVNSILSSETYCGVLRYGRRVTKGGRIEQRHPDEHILIDVPAIVSREVWGLAQERRAYNSKVSKRRMKRDYLLRGLIYCGCGRRMVGTQSKYVCTRRNDYFGEHKCKEPLIPTWLIESVTWDYIEDLIRDPVEFEQKLRAAQALVAATSQPQQTELEHVIALLEETEEEADVIVRELREAKAKREANGLTKDKGIIIASLERQADEVDRRYQAFIDRKRELETSLALDLTEESIDNMLKFRKAVALGLDSPTPLDKRQWLEILQVIVRVENGKAVISCRLGADPKTCNLFEINRC